MPSFFATAAINWRSHSSTSASRSVETIYSGRYRLLVSSMNVAPSLGPEAERLTLGLDRVQGGTS